MKEKKEIFIVEDEVEIGILLKEFLEENGFGVTLVNNGREAVKYLSEKLYDLLIIDMLLPGEHGMNIIKMSDQNYITPIIVVSGIYDETEILNNLKDYNVKFFIRKPFDLKDILKKINLSINADTV